MDVEVDELRHGLLAVIASGGGSKGTERIPADWLPVT
jgi:hypothetical protein